MLCVNFIRELLYFTPVKLSLIVKTPLGMERTAASYIAELDPQAKVDPIPMGFKGLVLVWGASEPNLENLIREKVPEVEDVVRVEKTVEARIEELVSAAEEIVKDKIREKETFAVKTIRRGRHSFTSIDVNVRVGDVVRRVTGATVDLRDPEKIVQVEIIGGLAALAVLPGNRVMKKMGEGKYPIYRVFRRISLVQMPYLGPLDACRTMGVRIGREAQTFEVGELVIGFIGAVSGLELKAFIDGVIEGASSRYEVQRRAYGRNVHRVPIKVADLYQLVRSRYNEHIIVFEPEGKPISQLRVELEKIFLESKRRVNILVGSRVGIPKGIYRFADMVVDVAPGITISTDYAAASALIAISTLIHDAMVGRKG